PPPAAAPPPPPRPAPPRAAPSPPPPPATTAASGSADRLARVSLPTRPSLLRNERRSSRDSYSRTSPDAVTWRDRTLTTCTAPVAGRPMRQFWHFKPAMSPESEDHPAYNFRAARPALAGHRTISPRGRRNFGLATPYAEFVRMIMRSIFTDSGLGALPTADHRR